MQGKAAEEGIAEMGTTLVMASIEDDSITIAHVGDSRCYVQRPGDGLIYQTEDHKVNVNGRQMLARCFFAGHPEAGTARTSRASDCRRATASCCAPTDSMEPSDEAFCWAR